MSLSLADMRRLLRKGLGGLSTQQLSDNDADELLNLALWSIEDLFPFKEKECLVEASTVDGQRSYAVPNELDALRSVAIYDDDQTHKLIRMGIDEFHERRDDDTDAEGLPKRYIRHEDAIYLEPVPDDVYTMQILMWRTVPSLVEGSVETLGLPRNWHEIVVEEAVVRGHFYNQDYNQAQQAKNFPLGQMRQAINTQSKEEGDSRYAGLEVQHEAPDGRD